MTEDQKIKLAILAIAEVLEVELPEKRLKLYHSALKDLGAAGLQCALAAVLASPDLRPGTMILPGKIREFAQGSIEDEAEALLVDLLHCVDNLSKTTTWNPTAYEVARNYGLNTIRDRSMSNTPTIRAQLRDAIRAKLSLARRERAERAMLPSFAEPNAIAGVLESVSGGIPQVNAEMKKWNGESSKEAGK